MSMHEQILKKYFLDEVDINCLVDNLIGGSIRIQNKVTSYQIQDMEETFEVHPEFIIKLLKDLMRLELDLSCLQQIAFILISSDNFYWNVQTKQNDEMDAVLNQWVAPEINYPLDKEHIHQCLEKLEKEPGTY